VPPEYVEYGSPLEDDAEEKKPKPDDEQAPVPVEGGRKHDK
jgi:hypothetical protein